MRWTHKHTGLTMLAVAGAVLAVAAMNPINTTPDESDPAGSAVSVDPTSDRPATEGAPAPATRPVTTLGNLDPPPDLPPPWGTGLDECVVTGSTDLAPDRSPPLTDTSAAGGHPATETWSPWDVAVTTQSAAAINLDGIAALRPGSPLRRALPRPDRPIC